MSGFESGRKMRGMVMMMMMKEKNGNKKCDDGLNPGLVEEDRV